jgi:hypothetical protein
MESFPELEEDCQPHCLQQDIGDDLHNWVDRSASSLPDSDEEEGLTPILGLNAPLSPQIADSP